MLILWWFYVIWLISREKSRLKPCVSMIRREMRLIFPSFSNDFLFLFFCNFCFISRPTSYRKSEGDTLVESLDIKLSQLSSAKGLEKKEAQ